jgi:hypothetical protein
MGRLDSSKTRVQPVFEALYCQDTTGEAWLRRLLGMAQREAGAETVAVPATLGHLAPPPHFEFPTDPPREYLEWLVMHPQALTSPPENAWKSWSGRTQEKRRALLAGDPAIQAEAIAELQKRSHLPRRAWWRLEGVTYVDCALLTETTAIFVEGKRTEIGPSKRVLWYPGRNQVLRVLDCAAAHARRTRRKHYFAILVVEEGLVKGDPIRQAEIEGVTSPSTVRESLPHLTDEERTALLSHYLGVTTWQAIVTGLDLEDDVLIDEAAPPEI